jgi:hypothetical protein
MQISRRIVATLLSLCAAAAGTGCASPGVGPRERELARLEEVEPHAGAPVQDFHFWSIDRWEGLGPEHVMIWTRPNEAWLIRVRLPCNGLEFAQSIGLSSTQNHVYRAHDAVLFEHQRCRIAELRPVDGRALKQARRARHAAEHG